MPRKISPVLQLWSGRVISTPGIVDCPKALQNRNCWELGRARIIPSTNHIVVVAVNQKVEVGCGFIVSFLLSGVTVRKCLGSAA